MGDAADLSKKKARELFSLLNENFFSSRVVNGIANQITCKTPKSKERLDLAVVDASLRTAREQLSHIETTTDFYKKGMVDPVITDIKEHLLDANAGYSALDDTGNNSAEEEEARLDRAVKRAHFIVDCREQVSADLRAGGYDLNMEDPIVKRLVRVVEVGKNEVLFEEDAKDRGSFIEQYSRAASLVYAQENLGRLENETVIYGSIMIDELLKKIRNHMKFAGSVAPCLGVPILAIPEDIEERINDATCRARFIDTCGELSRSEEISWLGGNKNEAMLTAAEIWEYLSNNNGDALPLDPSEYTPDCIYDLIDMININRFLGVEETTAPVHG